MKVELVSMTQPLQDGLKHLTPEELLVYIARVSNPSNQMNTETASKLLAYCYKNKHWSVFEGVSLTFEIETSRAITQQLVRHRSFTFQEFSQRYSNVMGFEPIELRKQGEKNRQSSAEIVNDKTLKDLVKAHCDLSEKLYNKLLEKDISRETARMILPLCTTSRLYMTGNVRSFIHLFEVRGNKATAQKEIVEIIEAMKTYFSKHFPNIAELIYG